MTSGCARCKLWTISFGIQCYAGWLMMMVAFITLNSGLVSFIQGLCSSNPCEFEFSVLDGIKLTTRGLTVPRSDHVRHACMWGQMAVSDAKCANLNFDFNILQVDLYTTPDTFHQSTVWPLSPPLVLVTVTHTFVLFVIDTCQIDWSDTCQIDWSYWYANALNVSSYVFFVDTQGITHLDTRCIYIRTNTDASTQLAYLRPFLSPVEIIMIMILEVVLIFIY